MAHLGGCSTIARIYGLNNGACSEMPFSLLYHIRLAQCKIDHIDGNYQILHNKISARQLASSLRPLKHERKESVITKAVLLKLIIIALNSTRTSLLHLIVITTHALLCQYFPIMRSYTNQLHIFLTFNPSLFSLIASIVSFSWAAPSQEMRPKKRKYLNTSRKLIDTEKCYFSHRDQKHIVPLRTQPLFIVLEHLIIFNYTSYFIIQNHHSQNTRTP